MLLSKIETAGRMQRLDTDSATNILIVIKCAISFQSKIQKDPPIAIELQRMTLTENIAAFAFPLPSSFATRLPCINKIS